MVDSISKRQAQRVKHSVVLIVLDGWGIAPPSKWNAISQAKIPNYKLLEKEFGSKQICASGTCVGLTAGQMGNSEVGHLTIGAGRVIFQDLMRVTDEFRSGKIEKNQEFLHFLEKSKKDNSALHLLGLLSDGGVHSHIDHLFSLLKIAKENDIRNIQVHAFLDGRDTPPKSGVDYAASLQSYLDSIGVGTIATISGRYYSMDRDSRWDRTKLAYDAIVYGEGSRFDDPIGAIKKSYEEGVTDEFVVPRVIGSYGGVKEGDSLFFFNFRPDRARQMTRALLLSKKEFGGLFERREMKRPNKINFLSMTIYDSKIKDAKALLKRERVSNTLSNVLERSSVRQLRIAETEKYAHVTYFFNGLVEKPRILEDRIMVPSLRIGTYDKMFEISENQITEKAISTIKSGRYGFTLINFANADMVGHSGNVEATIRAVETVDSCLGRIYEIWLEKPDKLTMMVTGDHGNAEKLYNESTAQPHTAHTSNPVPLVIVSKKWKISQSRRSEWGLVDLAPSILQVLDLKIPKTMTGRSIVEPIRQ